MKVLPLLVFCASVGAVSSVMYFNHTVQLIRDNALLVFRVNSLERQLAAVRKSQMELTDAGRQDFSLAGDTGSRLRRSNPDRDLHR